jgi:hypothetical protein
VRVASTRREVDDTTREKENHEAKIEEEREEKIEGKKTLRDAESSALLVLLE